MTTDIVRKANINDSEEIQKLVMNFSAKQLMLPKTMSEVYDAIRDFFVLEHDDKIVSCGALKVFWNDLAEIRSLATNEDFQHKGFGRKIVEYLLEDARNLKIYNVFTLSYQKEFFQKLGFSLIKKEDLPQKIWRDCYKCAKFPNCDENALLIKLES